MTAINSTSPVLYVAHYKWPFRLIALLFAAVFVTFRPSVAKMWDESGWFIGLAILLGYVFSVLGILETFVRRTWLTDSGINQRSIFGRTRFVPDEQVQELLIERDEALVVKYTNDRSLKVHAKKGHPEALIEAMRQFLDPNVRVVTV